MHRDMPKKNVKQLCALAVHDLVNLAKLAARNLPRLVANLPEPEPPQKMRRRLRHDVDLLEWKFFCVLSFLGDNDRPDAAQTGELPINVPHFGLEERRAVKRNARSWISRLVQVRN